MKIGIDIGGTSIKAGIVSGNKIIKTARIKTGKTKKEVIANLFKIIKELDNKKVKAIGIGCPGPADYQKGVIGNTPNIPLQNVKLKRIIENKFRKKVVMANDAQCFVLGESVRLKKKNAVGLTLGTGVGGGIVIDGRLYTGNGNAGHFGHCTIKFDGNKSSVNQGSIESYVSAKSIEKNYHKKPENLSMKEWAKVGENLGIGIANLINSFDPEIVVIGGGVAESFNKFKAGMLKEVKKRAIRNTPIVKGAKDSAIIGAASLYSKI
jgi:glucokinase